jgi:hypothetical protein
MAVLKADSQFDRNVELGSNIAQYEIIAMW